MSIAVPRPTFQPATQALQSAPVHQFRCQYTYDLVRKKKRWQDGFCNFHTHNKKVMLYDSQHIVIGGTHWQDSDVLQDGDELTLEQQACLLRVEEHIGSTVTDLAPLAEHRARLQEEKARQRPSSTAQSTRRDPATPGTPAVNAKHKALSSILQARHGPIGKAALPESPYEQRHAQQENVSPIPRPSKRRRIEDFSITRTASPRVQKAGQPLAQAESLHNTLNRKVAGARPIRSASQKQLPVPDVIDLVSTSPPPPEEESFVPLTDIEAHDTPVGSRPDSSTSTTRMPVRRLNLSGTTNRRPAHDESVDHVSTTNDVTEVMTDQQIDASDLEIPKAPSLLRIAKSAPRKKLLCQELAQKPRDVQRMPEKQPKNPSALPEHREDSSPAFCTLARNIPNQGSPKPRPKRGSRNRLRSVEGGQYVREMEAPVRKVDSELTSETMRSDVTIEPTFQPPTEDADVAMPTLTRRKHIRRVQSEADAELALASTNAFNISTIDHDDLADPPVRKQSILSAPQPNGDHNRNSFKRSMSDVSHLPTKPHRRSRTTTTSADPKPEKEQESGAWTIEATDFFDWRPPDWEERQSRLKKI